MRIAMLSLVVFLGGCLAVQPAHNPMKKGKKAKQEAAAPVAAKAEKPAAAPELGLPELDLPPAIDKVELMKEMFLVQQDLKAQVLKLAEDLSEAELAELNKFLGKRGVTIERKRVPKPMDNRRAF